MKTLFFIAAMCCAFATRALSAVVPATTYYFSSSFTGASNGTFTNPFKSLTALDSILRKVYPGITPNPGDAFLLKGGDTFNITKSIAPTISGAASAYITIGQYGIGVQPFISGWKRVTNWTQITGTKKWYATGVRGSATDVAMIRMGTTQANATFQNIGRWPNRNQNSAVDNKWYGGYLDLEKAGGTQVYDSNYTSETVRPTDNWAGAEIAVRNAHFRFVTHNIVSSTLNGKVMSFVLDASDTYYTSVGGAHGYIIQNHEKTLDQQGEWCYDKTLDKLTVYSATNPNSMWIEVPGIDNIIQFKASGGVGELYYDINNLEMTGANNDIVNGDGSAKYIDVSNCSLTFAGNMAIEFGFGSTNHNIDGNNIGMCMSFGMQMKTSEGGTANLYIGNNIVRDIMPVNGMGKNVNVPGCGFDLYGNNILVEYNDFHNIAYCAIDINDGSNQRVTKNTGDSVNVRIDDGGGMVYTANLKDTFAYRNKVIDSNYVTNSHLPEAYIGLPRRYNTLSGTMCFPFYGDKFSSRWKWKGNIAVDPQRGFYINDGSFDTLENNIIYNFSEQGVHLHNTVALDGDTNHVIRKNVAIGNVYYSPSSGASPFSSQKFDADKNGGLPKGYGYFNHQYFVYPMAQSTHNYFRANGSVLSWATWDSTYNYDTTATFYRGTNPTDATASNISRLVYNGRKYDSIISLGGKTYKDAVTGEQFNYDTIRLTPFAGKVLLYTGNYIANKAPTISLTTPLATDVFTSPATVVLNATAADADGSISKVEFFNGATKLQTVFSAPYTFTWSGVPTGSYTISAVATDNGGATTTATVKITVASSVAGRKYRYRKIVIN